MEKMTLVIEYAGNAPTQDAVISALTALIKAGTYMDTDTQPTVVCLSENEVAAAATLMARKSQQKGVTVKIETPEVVGAISKEDKARLIGIFKEILNV